MGKRVYIKDKEISLTTREYELLSLLVRNPKKIYSRDNLLHEVWGAAYPGMQEPWMFISEDFVKK